MLQPPALHIAINEFLAAMFQRQIAKNRLPLVARRNLGVRTDLASSRIPDVIVCSRPLWKGLLKRGGAGVFNTGEVPQLIVEIVSEDWRQDYIRKRAEYALIASSEYWIVDPHKQRIWILTELESENGYERVEFVRGQAIVSTVFPELVLSVDEILSPPMIEDLVRQELQALGEANQRVDVEQQRAEPADQRAKKLSEYLRLQGINPGAI